MTKTFCDRCSAEARVTSLVLSGARDPGIGSVTTLADIEVCARCVEFVIRAVRATEARDRVRTSAEQGET
jgi:hypothetical protein